MEGKMLPVEENPRTRAYLHYAFPMSILLTNNYYNDWIINNFIQLVYDPNNSCAFDYHEFSYEKWPCLKTVTMDATFLKDVEPVSYILGQLAQDRYCLAWVDCFYIAGAQGFNERHATEGILIYGFDSDQSLFHILTYDTHRRYTSLSISFCNVADSILSDEFQYLQFVNVISTASVDYHFESIRDKLLCYLSGQNYDLDDLKYHRRDEIRAYGTDACRCLGDYIINCEDDCFDLRYPYLFVEHKEVMIFRINMILQTGKFMNYPYTSEERNSYFEECRKVLYLCMKYNTSNKKSKDMRRHIRDYIHRLLIRERELLLPLL